MSNFPQKIYVHVDGKNFDGYATWDDAEEDDTVGIYQLVRVARVKSSKKKFLVDEEKLITDQGLEIIEECGE